MTLTYGFHTSTVTALELHVWQSTAYVLVAWLVTLALRSSSARIRFAVWWSASLKFLIPFALLSELGASLAKPYPHAHARTVFYTAVEEIGHPFAKGNLALPQPADSVNSDWHWGPSLLAGIWLCGFLALLLRWVLLWWSAHRLVAEAPRVDEGRELVALRRAKAMAEIERPIAMVLTQRQIEPGIFGIVNPVMMWPVGLSERLDPTQIAAIMAHEVEHVRRHDNLSATVHAWVQALFWFHPALYWIGSRMNEERERACDERVVALQQAPEKYAESILKVCAFCLERPLACVSGVSGADLKLRVLRIMNHRCAMPLTFARRILLTVVAILTIALPVGFGIMQGQNKPATLASGMGSDASVNVPKFDVISIKPADSKDDRRTLQFTPDGILIHGTDAHMLLRTAFGVEDDRIVGAPGWAKSNRFDVEAKVAPEDAAKVDKLKLDGRRAMLIPLLEERFHLKYHHETRELPMYALVVSNGGPKLQVAKPELGSEHSPTPFGGTPPKGIDTQGRTMMSPGQIESQNTTLDMLAHALAPQLGRTVVDKTGLTGRYDYTLKWTPDRMGPSMMSGDHGMGAESGTDAAGVPLFTAIQEQLGLRLESVKGMVDVIVIDHLDLPSAN